MTMTKVQIMQSTQTAERIRLQIKECNFCLENVCDSHTRGFLCSNCHYNKFNQWEDTYPGMIGKKPNEVSAYF